jgi:hypothetical protein
MNRFPAVECSFWTIVTERISLGLTPLFLDFRIKVCRWFELEGDECGWL